MSSEFKGLLKRMIFYDIIIGLICSSILCILFGIKFMLIFLIGLSMAVINFIVSGIVLEKSLSPNARKGNLFLVITYIIRIVIVILVAVPFLYDLKNILAYLGGFIMHHPILIYSWFNSQKGSE